MLDCADDDNGNIDAQEIDEDNVEVPYSGVKSLIQSFGAEIQRNLLVCYVKEGIFFKFRKLIVILYIVYFHFFYRISILRSVFHVHDFSSVFGSEIVSSI